MPNKPKIKVAILDDHQSIIDGYRFRLGAVSEIEVVATASFGEQLTTLLASAPVDVVLLDVGVPISKDNTNPYPILHHIPQLLQMYPNLAVLVISMHTDRALIKAVVESGASGYIVKDDQAAIESLGAVVQSIAQGGVYFSDKAYTQLNRRLGVGPTLTARQLEALSMCAAYPDESTAALARRLAVAHSTMRNLLHGAYIRLNVNSRAAAIAKARELGLITPYPVPPVTGPGTAAESV